MTSRLLITAMATLVALAAPLQEASAASTFVFRPPISSKNKLTIGGDTALPGAPGPDTPTQSGPAGKPVMENIPHQTFQVGDSVNITPSVIDAGTGAPFDLSGYTFKHTQTLPAGLTFDFRTGAITGTATAPALIRYITIQATKLGSPSVSRYYELRIEPAQAMAIVDPSSLSNVVRQSSSTSVAAGPAIRNGYGSLTFVRTGGLSVNYSSTTGALTYSATTAKLPLGVHTVNMRATDAMGRTLDYTHTIDVRNLDLTIPSVISVNPGKEYVGAAVATFGAVGTKTFSYTGLPAGLSYDSSTGAISGTVSLSLANTDHPASVTVTDADGGTASRSFTLHVNKAGHRYWRFRSTSARQFNTQLLLHLAEVKFLGESGNAITPNAFYETGSATNDKVANALDGNLASSMQKFYPASSGQTSFGNQSSVRVDLGDETSVIGVEIDVRKLPAATNGYWTYPPLAWAVEWSDSGYSGPWTVAFTGSNPQSAWDDNQHYLSLAP